MCGLLHAPLLLGLLYPGLRGHDVDAGRLLLYDGHEAVAVLLVLVGDGVDEAVGQHHAVGALHAPLGVGGLGAVLVVGGVVVLHLEGERVRLGLLSCGFLLPFEALGEGEGGGDEGEGDEEGLHFDAICSRRVRSREIFRC